MCACTCFPHCIWMLKLITPQAGLFSAFNCVCAVFTLAHTCRQLVSSQGFEPSMGPVSIQLDYRVDSGGTWAETTRDLSTAALLWASNCTGGNQGPPSCSTQLCPQATAQRALHLGTTSKKPSAHLLSLEEGFVLCSAVLSKSANLERTCNCMWVHVYVFTRESEQSQAGRKVWPSPGCNGLCLSGVSLRTVLRSHALSRRNAAVNSAFALSLSHEEHYRRT